MRQCLTCKCWGGLCELAVGIEDIDDWVNVDIDNCDMFCCEKG